MRVVVLCLASSCITASAQARTVRERDAMRVPLALADDQERDAQGADSVAAHPVIRLDMRVNVDGAVILRERFNEHGSGAEMRRVRFGVESQFNRHWSAEVEVDLADSRAELEDAFLMYEPRAGLRIRWGNFKEVFSLEQNTSSRDVTFLERPMVTRALTPSRTLGTHIVWARPYVLLAGGVHFQKVGGWEEVQNRQDNNEEIGADEGYSLTGKVILLPWYHDEDGGVHLGLATSRRTPKTDDEIGTVRFDTEGPSTVNRRTYLDTDRIADVDHWLLTGLDAAAYHRGFRVQGEVNTIDLTRSGEPDRARFDGWYVMASVMLLGGRHQYDKSQGEFTAPVLGRGWGDVEIGARLEHLDLNSASAAILGGSGEAWTLGLNVYPNDNVKFMLNMAVVDHDRFANGNGTLNVGTTSTGALTTNPLLAIEPDGEAGEDYTVLMVRVQVAF